MRKDKNSGKKSLKINEKEMNRNCDTSFGKCKQLLNNRKYSVVDSKSINNNQLLI
ncbi:hypothetical protein DCPSUM001_35290 [Dysgonomonas capnocytophagoides]|nr:hypothetical protein DCPSUM001_35290 [Dysgonomonas capnocytophagoides]